MSQDNDKIREARKRYVFDRQSIPVIALSVGFSERTVRRWKSSAKQAGDDWDVARSVNTVAGEGLDKIVAMVIEDFVILSQATIEDLKVSKDIDPQDKAKSLVLLSDSMVKAVAAAGRLAPDISQRAIATRVMHDLYNFVLERFPEHEDFIREINEPFQAFLMEAYE